MFGILLDLEYWSLLIPLLDVIFAMVLYICSVCVYKNSYVRISEKIDLLSMLVGY